MVDLFVNVHYRPLWSTFATRSFLEDCQQTIPTPKPLSGTSCPGDTQESLGGSHTRASLASVASRSRGVYEIVVGTLAPRHLRWLAWSRCGRGMGQGPIPLPQAWPANCQRQRESSMRPISQVDKLRHASNRLDSFVLLQSQHCQAESPTFDTYLRTSRVES